MNDGLNVAAELAGLRGDMNTGFARIEGQLGQLVQSDAQRQRDLDELETRVAALEARRWPVAGVAAVSGAVSAVVAAVALLVQ